MACLRKAQQTLQRVRCLGLRTLRNVGTPERSPLDHASLPLAAVAFGGSGHGSESFRQKSKKPDDQRGHRGLMEG